MKSEIPSAKPGDQFTFQVAPRPVMAATMMEAHDEIQVLGIIPNTADGARVAVGAAIRPKGVDKLANPQVAYCALLDPQQALETAAIIAQLAQQAATLRGQKLNLQAALPIAKSELTTQQAHDLAEQMPGQGIADDKGDAIGKPRPGVAVAAAVTMPGSQIAAEGILGVGGITMPDRGEWLSFCIRTLDGREATAHLPLNEAATFIDLVTATAIDAANRERLTAAGKAS